MCNYIAGCEMHTDKSSCMLSFFTANSLARDITRLGDEEFAGIGTTPSYAFLRMLAAETAKISQKEISQEMNMGPLYRHTFH